MHAPLEPSAPSRMAIGGAALTMAGVILSGPIGFVAHCIWNVLVFVLASLVVIALRARRQPV